LSDRLSKEVEWAMPLNDLLIGDHIDPKQVFVLRHWPTEPALNKIFPLIRLEATWKDWPHTRSPSGINEN
jgi:hypothetical protein